MAQLTKVGVALTSELSLERNAVRDTLLDERSDDFVGGVSDLGRTVQSDSVEGSRSRVGVEERAEVRDATSTGVRNTVDATELNSLTNRSLTSNRVAQGQFFRNQQTEDGFQVVRHKTRDAGS